MPTIVYSNFRDSGAGNLVEYLDKEDGLKNRRGEELTDRERLAFVEKSEEYEHSRMVVFSPENGNELTDEEMSLATRQTMQEFNRDRPTADYVYAVHRDSDHDHAQVAVTGADYDMRVTKDELNELRSTANEHFYEQGRQREHDRSHDIEQSLDDEQQHLEEELRRQRELEEEQEHEDGQEWGPGL